MPSPHPNASLPIKIQRGANQARSDDTKGLKPVIIDWLSPPDEPLQPSLSRTVKVDRGFNHYRISDIFTQFTECRTETEEDIYA